MDKNSSRHSLRLKDYDYSKPGAYFLTMVTYQRESQFGEIINAQMHLNPKGKIVYDIWQSLPDRFPEIVVDEMTVMPNHVHGIVFIEEYSAISLKNPNQNNKFIEIQRESFEESRVRRRRMIIPKMVGYFKMNTAKGINQILKSPGIRVWQRNYFEHIIRNDDELNKIREYIICNPKNW